MNRAYHEIVLPDGTLVEGPVVCETDKEGHLVSWHLLRQEEPFTEWLGGRKEFGSQPKPPRQKQQSDVS